MSFERWKDLPPVVHVASFLSFDEELSVSSSWEDYTKRFIAANGDDGSMIKAARRLTKKLSTTEIAVLAAMLHAGEYSHIADEITGVGVWSRLGRTRGDHNEAVVLAISKH